MVDNDHILEKLTLIEELDQQQNALLDQLDELNRRIEAVLASLGDAGIVAPPETIPMPRRAAA